MHNLSSARILPKDSHEVEFLPGTICKSSLSPAKVQERQEACTAIHLASLQQDEAFKKWHQSSQRRQWTRQPRSYRYLLLGAVTALAVFLLLVATISLNRPIDLSAAHLLNGAASQTTSDSPGEHADIHNKEALQAKSRQSGAQHRVDTALFQRQLATPQQQEKEQKQENIALDTARDKVSDEEPAAHLKNLPFEQQQKQQKSQAAVQPIEGQQQIIDVGIGTQTQQQFHDINQRLSAAERESIEKTSHLDTTAQTATFAPLKREHGQLGRQRLHVAPPLWALQQVAHAKQCIIEHTKALRLWQLLAEIIATAMALYFALRLLLGFTDTKDLNSIQAAMPTRAGADALPVKKRQFADRLSDNQSVPPTQQHEAAAKAESAATSGRIRQVVSYKEAVALGEAQKQLEGMGHDLIAAKAQVKTSSAHAAALQKQLAKVKLELEASTADTSRLNDQQQAFQRELDQARALEAQLVMKVQDAETLQAKALSQLEDTASKAAVTASALTAQAAQTADARRALEAKDVERAEIVQELQELRSSFQTVKRGREEAQKALHKALQRSEMASCRAQETAKKLSDQHAAVEQMKGDMQKAARVADEQIESLSRDRKTLARHLEDAQARLSQVDSPRKSSRSGRRSDSGQTSNNLLPTSSTLLRCQSSADSLKSQVDDSAASETTGRADNLQSQLLEAQAEIRTLQQRSDRAEQTMLVAKQGQADAEAAAQQAREDLSEADREQELLEAQLEQLTGSLRHTSARKQELETELHNFRQDKGFTEALFDRLRNQADEIMIDAPLGSRHSPAQQLLSTVASAEGTPDNMSPVSRCATPSSPQLLTHLWEPVALRGPSAMSPLSSHRRSSPSFPHRSRTQPSSVLKSPTAGSPVPMALSLHASPLRNLGAPAKIATSRGLSYEGSTADDSSSSDQKLPPTITGSTVSAPFSHPAGSVISDGTESLGDDSLPGKHSPGDSTRSSHDSLGRPQKGDGQDTSPVLGSTPSGAAPLTPLAMEGLASSSTSKWLRRMGAPTPSPSVSSNSSTLSRSVSQTPSNTA